MNTIELKRKASGIARDLLLSNENYLDRILELWKIGNSIYGSAWDTEFHIFGVISSETDHLPTSKVKEYCSENWLVKSDKELEEIISFYSDQVAKACKEILLKYEYA